MTFVIVSILHLLLELVLLSILYLSVLYLYLRILQKKGCCCNDCLYRQYDTLPPCQLFNYQVLRFVHTMVYLPHLVRMIFHNYFTLSTSVHNYSTRHNKLYLSHVSSSSSSSSSLSLLKTVKTLGVGY